MCTYTEFDHISQAPDSVFNYHCEHVFSTTIFLISAKFVQKLYLGKFFKNAFCLEPDFELQAIHFNNKTYDEFSECVEKKPKLSGI